MDAHTIVSILLFISPLVLFMKKTMQGRGKRFPPGPSKLPIIGSLHQLGTLPHQSLSQFSKIHGPVMLLKLGKVPTLVISSPESAKEVLITRDSDCCSRPPLTSTRRLTYGYKDMTFGPYGDYWKDMRKMCVLELFSAKRVKLFQPIREEEVNSMINSISQSASTGDSVDLTQKLYALTGSITFKVAFGKSFKGSRMANARFQELLHDAQALLASFAASDFFPNVGWIVDWLTGLTGKLERVFRELDGFFQEIIEDHLNPERKGEGQEDIVDVMLRIEKENRLSGKSWFTKNHIKGILLDIFLGGVDTSAITTVWALSELVKCPEAMKRAQDEVRSCVRNKEKVTEEDTDKLVYLKMVVKETLRLHPAGPLLLPRETLNECRILNYDRDPKTHIHLNVWAIGRDPSLWKRPDDFIPKRFLDSPLDYKGQHFEYLPFGSGRKICPAISMGIVTVELALANLLYHFDWEMPDGMKKEDLSMEEHFGLATCKKVALKLVPTNYKCTE